MPTGPGNRRPELDCAKPRDRRQGQVTGNGTQSTGVHPGLKRLLVMHLKHEPQGDSRSQPMNRLNLPPKRKFAMGRWSVGLRSDSDGRCSKSTQHRHGDPRKIEQPIAHDQPGSKRLTIEQQDLAEDAMSNMACTGRPPTPTKQPSVGHVFVATARQRANRSCQDEALYFERNRPRVLNKVTTQA